jgi:GDP-4-dehydro-6-deoxy-D-mannose reductase
MIAERYETVLVTGAAGFVGGHLLAHVAAAPNAPAEIVAVDVRQAAGGPAEWVACDLTDAASVAAVMEERAPQAVIHLAGLMAAPDPHDLFAANVQAADNLLAAAATLPHPPRMLFVGSAAQYGVTAGEFEVLDETRPLLASSLYGVTKTLQEAWALACGEARSIPVVCVRPFNLMGPGQPRSLVPAAFLHQVADVVDGRAKEVCVGNTSTSRDFTDVRDIVAAIWALAAGGEGAIRQVFNIASGHPVRIQDMLEACLALAGRPVPVRQEPSRIRVHDVPTIIGDAAKLRQATGWQPRIPWRQSVQDMWDALRNPQPL